MLGFEGLIQKICEHANLTEEKVRELIQEKRNELSGLVSEEGAAYIVGRELGLNLLKDEKRLLKVGNVVPGIKTLDIVAKVVRVFEPREFEKEGKKGAVQSLILGDETGTIRMPLWNEEIKLLENLGIKEGDVVKISGGFAKLDYKGQAELRLGRGDLEKADEEIGEVKRQAANYERKPIAGLKDGMFAEVRGTILQMYQRNPFYAICPKCGSKAADEDGKMKCKEHGEVEPDFNMVISGVVDDGTGNIRAVFFRELAEKLFGKTTQELRQLAMKKSEAAAVFEAFPGVGKEYIIQGRVKRNDYTESIELVASGLEEPDVKKEIETLLG